VSRVLFPHIQRLTAAPAPAAPEPEPPEEPEDDQEETDVARARAVCDEGHPLRGWNRTKDGACRRCAMAAGRAKAKRTPRPTKKAPSDAPPSRIFSDGVAVLRAEREQLAARLAKIDQALALLEQL
jgi:hypothetical protein